MSIVTSLIGAGANYLNGQSEIKAQKQIAANNLAQQQAQWGTLKTDAQPFLNSAGTALNNLTPTYNQEQAAYSNLQDPSKTFQTSPGYNFELNQGTQAVLGNSALNGLLNSGSAIKALNNYAQGQADQQYNTYVGQLQNQFSDAQGLYNGQLQTAQGLGNTGLGSLATATAGVSNALNQNANAQSNVAAQQFANNTNLISSLTANPQVMNGVQNGLNNIYQYGTSLFNGGGGSSYSTQGGSGAITPTQTYTI